MADAPDMATAPPGTDNSAKAIAIVVYALLILGISNGVTALAAVILAAIKRRDAFGTPYESHLTNAIVTFFVVFVVGALLVGASLELIFGTVLFLAKPVSTWVWHPAVLALFPLIWIGFALLAIFFLYRTIKGLVRAIEGKPYR